MSDFYAFGDMVLSSMDEGLYMVIGPYLGKRRANDPKGPALWVADISTEYSKIGEGSTIWMIESALQPYDE